ncbi:hypothetical protein MVES1_002023 [Malassezia vespertilionis]|uniref:Domain of unknown function at the cortex 1 domain-containing protein n=1 Tax=Malassezia vespertilionis TaxID=2020962 RepID=A0A2N1JC20_9BASI|nr:uncharacterized protein MVES1_002023 [Malassezia vespertilionis]PKI84085.1 hypothetical protein MVES_001914 [Malassezia vespertilionis]WFD06669.1 hypothetical protein MVES1_002023 [Malassezia vespertilionis]
MTKTLSISAGPSVDALEILAVNHDDKPVVIDSGDFHGRVTVRIKDFRGVPAEGVPIAKNASYFSEPYGDSMTYSIQAQGVFTEEVSAADLVFGNMFDHPLRDSLPYGTSIALRFASFVDPTIQHDLYADKPWAFSPLLATVYRAQANRAEPGTWSAHNVAKTMFEDKAWPPFPTPDGESKEHFTRDDIAPLFKTYDNGELVVSKDLEKDKDAIASLGSPDQSVASHARAKWLGIKQHREDLMVTPDDVITVDFCNGYIDFNQLHLKIPYGGLEFDLGKYYNGQPVRYVCKNIRTKKIYFIVQFDLVEDKDEKEVTDSDSNAATTDVAQEDSKDNTNGSEDGTQDNADDNATGELNKEKSS